MRWILVFIFLYLIPLIVLFRNNKNFKKACMYGSIYIVLATTIVISNIYMSGLNKIEEALYYQNYAFDQRYKDKYVSNFEKDSKNKHNKENAGSSNVENESSNQSNKESKDKNVDNPVPNIEDKETEKEAAKEKIKSSKKSDLERLDEFKQDIYDIEKVALLPMRDCIPYTKDIAKNLSKISEIRDDIVYAEEMCNDVIDIYSTMEIPKLSKDEYEIVLSNARDDVKKAYELRKKAMESAIKLLDTKNPKYIGKITEYLKLSDNQIASFKERVKDLKAQIDEN